MIIIRFNKGLNFVMIILLIGFFEQSPYAQLGLHVEGNQTVLFGKDTTDEGYKFIWNPTKGALRGGYTDTAQWDYDSIGYSSFAFGLFNTASGSGSAAWGGDNHVGGLYASAWGFSNTASNVLSSTWGNNNLASGGRSTVWGSNNRASGLRTTVWGEFNIAQSPLETVIGRFADTLDHANLAIWEEDDYLFVVGNGTSANNRSNALTLYKSGDLSVDRKLTIESYDSPWGVEDDDCVLSADPSKNNSDLILVANDAVAINIDDDNNSNSSFQVLNGTDDMILKLDENGNLNITGTLFQGSDRNRKEKIQTVEPDQILQQLEQLSVYEWQYKGEETRHLGPMAQDFHQIFGYGADDKSLSAVDVDGVLLTAIKAQQKEIEELKELLLAQQKLIKKIEARR